MLLKGISVLAAVVSIAIMLLASPAWWSVLPVYALVWLALLALAFGVLCLLCALVDLNKPQHSDSKFYRFVMHLCIEAVITLVPVTVHAEGLEKTPKSTRFLLVCNHQSDVDPGVLLHCFRTSQLAFISKQENRNMFAVGKFMHKTLCQMINRENDREALKTILKCIQLIKDDLVSVAVFPEGGIKAEKKLTPFRSGVFKIAQKANVPIVVCTLNGTTDVLPNLKRLKHSDIHLHLLEVIPPWELEGKTTVEIAERVYAIMLEDLGESWNPENE